MNTADRSVEALDTALRRRFTFEEMMPDYNVRQLQTVLPGLSFSNAQLLKAINNRIELLKNRDYQIGHAYFIHMQTLTNLSAVLKDKIFPLLQEYFYNDFEKIQLVMGRGFIGKASSNTIVFASHESELNDDYQDKERYYLLTEAFKSNESLIEALSLMNIQNA